MSLASNGLSGSIPALEQYHNLTHLDLSYNRLTGTIPDKLQSSPSLLSLNLRSNRFSGNIDSTAGLVFAYNMSQQGVRLTLSVNRLSGDIPSELSSAEKVDILEGNLFYCHGTISSESLPESDPYKNQYICGSNLLDISLQVLLTTASSVMLVVFVAAALLWRTIYDLKQQQLFQAFHEGAVDNSINSDSNDEQTIQFSKPNLPGNQDLFFKVNYPKLIHEWFDTVKLKYFSIVTLDNTIAHLLQQIEFTRHTMLKLVLNLQLAVVTVITWKLRTNALLAPNSNNLSIPDSSDEKFKALQFRIETKLPHLVAFLNSLRILYKICIILMLIIVISTLPLYESLKGSYSTVEFQYSWQLSGLFLAGNKTAVAIIILWFIILAIFSLSIVWFIPYVVVDDDQTTIAGVKNGVVQKESVNKNNIGDCFNDSGSTHAKFIPTSNVAIDSKIDEGTIHDNLNISQNIDIVVSRQSINQFSADKKCDELNEKIGDDIISSTLKTSEPGLQMQVLDEIAVDFNPILIDVSVTEEDQFERSSNKFKNIIVSNTMLSMLVSTAMIVMFSVSVLVVKMTIVAIFVSNKIPHDVQLFLEFILSLLDLLWSYMLVPHFVMKVPNLSPKYMLLIKVAMFYINSTLAAVIAVALTNSSCFLGYFVTLGNIQINDDFSICTEYLNSSCVVRANIDTTVDISPSYYYNYSCTNTVLQKYIPIFILSNAFAIVLLPLFILLLTAPNKPKSCENLFEKILPRIFTVEIDNHTDNANTTTLNAEVNERRIDRSATEERPLLVPSFILAAMIHHIIQLITFGVVSQPLAFAIVAEAMLMWFVWESAIGRYLLHHEQFNQFVRDSCLEAANSGRLSTEFQESTETTDNIDITGGLEACCRESWLAPYHCLTFIIAVSAVFVACLAMDMVGDKVCRC